MSTKKLLTRFKAMSLEVDTRNGLDRKNIVVRQLLTVTNKLYGVQRQYELMHLDNPDANCKKFTEAELGNLKEANEINRSIGKLLGAIKRAKMNTAKV